MSTSGMQGRTPLARTVTGPRECDPAIQVAAAGAAFAIGSPFLVVDSP
jgi:hypothetical protein